MVGQVSSLLNHHLVKFGIDFKSLPAVSIKHVEPPDFFLQSRKRKREKVCWAARIFLTISIWYLIYGTLQSTPKKNQPYRLIDRLHSKVPSHLHRFGTGFHRRIADASITGSNWRHRQLKGLAQGQGHTGWRWHQPRGYRHSQARRHPLRGQTALQAFRKLGRRKASRQRPGSQRILGVQMKYTTEV